MSISYENLLKKKGWTGKEVGAALFASLIQDIRNLGQTEKAPLPFTQEDLERMEHGLRTDRDHDIYDLYVILYSSITDIYNGAQAQYQQFYNGFSRLLLELREVQNAEHAQGALEDTPLIVTRSQYDRLQQRAAAELKARKASYAELVFDTLLYFLEEDPDNPAPEDLRAAIDACKERAAASNRYLPYYNRYYDDGYYELPDGRRSDQLTADEWQAAMKDLTPDTETGRAVISARGKLFMTAGEYLYKGADALRAYVLERTGRELTLSDEELMKDLDEAAHHYGLSSADASLIDEAFTGSKSDGVIWHTYDKPPENLTLYDMLELYASAYGGTLETPDGKDFVDGKDALKHLKTDAPEVYAAIAAYIEKRLPAAKELKPNQLKRPMFTWGELADAGVLGYSGAVIPSQTDILELYGSEDTAENYEARQRINHSGIAVIQEPRSYQTDERGDYKQTADPMTYLMSIYRLAEDEERGTDVKRYASRLIYPALRYLYAFNELIKIIADVYDLPELGTYATYDLSSFEYKANGYNGLLYVLYGGVYGSDEERRDKRELIKELFPHLDIDSTKPTEQATAEVRRAIEKLGYTSDARRELRYLDSYINQLMPERGA